jgi:hypothetical protein
VINIHPKHINWDARYFKIKVAVQHQACAYWRPLAEMKS